MSRFKSWLTRTTRIEEQLNRMMQILRDLCAVTNIILTKEGSMSELLQQLKELETQDHELTLQLCQKYDDLLKQIEDLKEDPIELSNLIADQREVLDELKKRVSPEAPTPEGESNAGN